VILFDSWNCRLRLNDCIAADEYQAGIMKLGGPSTQVAGFRPRQSKHQAAAQLLSKIVGEHALRCGAVLQPAEGDLGGQLEEGALVAP
jgi:hypothetical protein